VEHAREKYELSERLACQMVKQWRGTKRYNPIQRMDEDALTRTILTLVSEHCRYGYRRITALLRMVGWRVGKDRVQRIWHREGLKLPAKQWPWCRLRTLVLIDECTRECPAIRVARRVSGYVVIETLADVMLL
jgi:hypothetical protein